VQVAVDSALQLFEHLEEGQVPRVEGHAPIGGRERLVPLVDGSSVDDGNLKLGENLAAGGVQVAGVMVHHGVVEVQVLVAGHVRDVDGVSVVVFEFITLHEHLAFVSGEIEVEQLLGQGYRMPMLQRGIVLTTAVLDQF